VNTAFSGSTLTNTKFDDAYLQGADFSTAMGGKGCSLSNAAVATAPGAWSFTAADGTPFTLAYQPTKLGPLGTSEMVRCPNGQSGPCCNANGTCLAEKLKPEHNGPRPPIPACAPVDDFECATPLATATPERTRTPTPR
jgi:uncharacterized protein YjbI with pentapeptide repeats